MTYPAPTDRQIEFFRTHGFLVVEDAIPQADLDELELQCEKVMQDKERLANDWAWDSAESKDKRSFRILQSSPSFVWKEIRDAHYRQWLVPFGSALIGKTMSFWYDQYLAKPPGKSVPTYWHQDEGYWGRNLWDRGITCWIPLQDVDAQNGCMHFVDGGHLDGVRPHRLVDGVQS
ncbi:MAG TPA: phytanoyl-CoA dioxygenase family protein, partial [Rhizomicrobium sp.]|nr:phytanoyl-CoA dioxygenase family protein [Rhizomicrobium sp.]